MESVSIWTSAGSYRFGDVGNLDALAAEFAPYVAIKTSIGSPQGAGVPTPTIYTFSAKRGVDADVRAFANEFIRRANLIPGIAAIDLSYVR
jgi:hypothetical protein